MNFSIKNFFIKSEHIRIKMRIYSHLLNKSLTENYIFCVVNIIGFTTEFAGNFSSNIIVSLSIVYVSQHLIQIRIQSPLLKSILVVAVNNSTFTLASA